MCHRIFPLCVATGACANIAPSAACTDALLLAVADLHGDLKQSFKALLLAGAVDGQVCSDDTKMKAI